MNTLWLSNLEILNEERRADFRREMEQIRLEYEVKSTRARKTNLLDRGMTALSTWLVATGERLHRHYSDPTPLPRWYQSFKLAR